ncbi:EamA family transporter [Candidatus Harpocratesius sp.]
MGQKPDSVQILDDLRDQIPTFQSNRVKGITLSFISLFLLGILPIISNSRPNNLSALSYALYLSIWELLCSLPLFIYELKSQSKGIFLPNISSRVRSKSYLVMLISGIIFSISTFFYVFSFEHAGTVNAAIALQTYPLFSILWETIFLKKPKPVDELIFTCLIIVGIYYIGTEGTFVIHNFSIWFGIALITPLLWSVAHVMIKNMMDQSPITPNQVTFFRVFLSSLILFILSIIIEPSYVVFSGLFNFSFQKYAFFMGLIYYLELVNWFYAVKHVNVSVASTITTPTPILTMLLAMLFLQEQPHTYQIVGMIVVIVALYCLIWRGNHNAK